LSNMAVIAKVAFFEIFVSQIEQVGGEED
jgi:hypothetical protein